MRKIKLQPVKYLPLDPRRAKKYDELILEFYKSNHHVCKVLGVKRQAAMSFINVIRRLKLHTKIWVARRGKDVYLFRLEEKKMGGQR